MKKRGRWKNSYHSNPQHSKSFFSFIKNFAFVFTILAFSFFIAGFFFVLKNPKIFPFHEVTIVVNRDHIKTSELKKMVTDNLEGGFFSFNAPQMRDALLGLSWISEVSFRRLWPGELI